MNAETDKIFKLYLENVNDYNTSDPSNAEEELINLLQTDSVVDIHEFDELARKVLAPEYPAGALDDMSQDDVVDRIADRFGMVLDVRADDQVELVDYVNDDDAEDDDTSDPSDAEEELINLLQDGGTVDIYEFDDLARKVLAPEYPAGALDDMSQDDVVDRIADRFGMVLDVEADEVYLSDYVNENVRPTRRRMRRSQAYYENVNSQKIKRRGRMRFLRE